MIQHILVLMALLSSNQNSKTVFEFNSACPIELWQVVDDVVMGGKSSGNFTLTEEGNGLFNGDVSIS
jgi:NADH dehydrogenase [ubiquinone] 1 alpha subcomplex assembly factor 1